MCHYFSRAKILLILWLGVIGVLLFLAYLMMKFFRCPETDSTTARTQE